MSIALLLDAKPIPSQNSKLETGSAVSSSSNFSRKTSVNPRAILHSSLLPNTSTISFYHLLLSSPRQDVISFSGSLASPREIVVLEGGLGEFISIFNDC